MISPLPDTVLLIDPTPRLRGGIASYTALAEKEITALGRVVRTIKRSPAETADRFRRRVARTTAALGGRLAHVEAPETGAATLLLPREVPVHIRLHMSRALGGIWEGRTPDPVEVATERAVVAAAKWLSAPSFAAARDAARVLPIRPDIRVFPNPVPRFTGGSNPPRQRHALIASRAQTLKGLGFIPALARALPRDFGIVLVGEGMREAAERYDLPASVRALPELSAQPLRKLMSEAAVVAVPSLFETFSLVAAEALASATPVVTWQHSGTAELAPAPLVRRVGAWNVDSFASAIGRAADEPASPDDAYRTALKRLSNGFAKGQIAILEDRDVIQGAIGRIVLQPEALSVPPEFILHSTTETEGAVSTSIHRGSLNRRLRKLARDPRAFLRDAPLSRHLRALSDRVTRRQPEASEKPLSLPTPLAGAPYPCIGMFDPAVPDMNPADHRPQARQFSSLVFLRPDQVTAAAPAFTAMAETGRGSAFSPANMTLAFVTRPFTAPAWTVVTGTSNATRDRLARFRYLIFLGDHGTLPAALRSFHHESRVVQVLLPGPHGTPAHLSAAETDILIDLRDGAARPEGHWRRFLSGAGGLAVLPDALARALQEAGPKPLDVLLPAWGSCAYDPGLLEEDVTRVQGIVLLRQLEGAAAAPSPSALPRPMDRLVTGLAPRIDGVLLAESVMWRYRTMVDAARTGEDWARLLRVCAEDGVRIDWREAA